ncbi:Endonuclease/exonuclease/phosphatase [Burkholderia sp. H160]|nr:Endonuclease/exonuclease/phosphatase [Burkholderia sp. H160]
MARLRIATFNLNGIRPRLAALLQWLVREAPDVVCLQELKAVDSAFPVDALRDAGYGAVWQGQSAWNGVAILAKGAWTDALRTRFGDERVYTFWDYFRRHWDTNSGLRIDHLLLSAELAPRLRDAGVDRWVRGEPHASDHAPTWIELEMGAGRKKQSG